MSRYVDVDKLHNQGWVAARYKNWEPTPLNDNFKLEVEVKPFITFPAADVQEVRHGSWVAEDNDGSWSSATCSVCGRRVGLAHYETDFVKHFPYCHCGAKMDEVEE